MRWKALRAYCLSLPGATETFPFEPTVSVFKAANLKMFAVTAESSVPTDLTVKCDPDIGEALRTTYESIEPGYHLNKRHWITITLGGDVADERVRELVLDSYQLVAPKVAAAGARASSRRSPSRAAQQVDDRKADRRRSHQ